MIKKNTKSETELRKERRQNKFDTAREEGWATFQSVIDGLINSKVYLRYDSFEETFKCSLSNLGSFDIKRGGDIHIKLGSCSGPFAGICHWRDLSIFKYRLDDGPILSDSRNEFYDEKKEMVYLPFNW